MQKSNPTKKGSFKKIQKKNLPPKIALNINKREQKLAKQ